MKSLSGACAEKTGAGPREKSILVSVRNGQGPIYAALADAGACRDRLGFGSFYARVDLALQAEDKIRDIVDELSPCGSIGFSYVIRGIVVDSHCECEHRVGEREGER